MALSAEGGEKAWLSRWEGWQVRARQKHANKYSYPSPQREGKPKKIQIACPDHGLFWQEAGKHMFGQGCAKCQGFGSDKLSQVKAKFPSWGWPADLEIVNSKTRFTLNCPVHGSFETLFNRLMNKTEGLSPCPKCARAEWATGSRVSVSEWVDRVKQAWGEGITLVKSSFVTGEDKANFICQDHGDFRSKVADVAGGHGCPKCGSERFLSWSDENVRVTADEFVDRANSQRQGLYKYYKETYTNMTTPMKMGCSTHGDFWQRPGNHIQLSAGCPKCGKSISKGESEIEDFLKQQGFQVTTRSRPLDGWEIDIFVEDHNLGIEYCGNYWHGELYKENHYHSEKLKRADEAGIRLVTIFEDEWLEQGEKVRSRLLNLLGKSRKIAARKCKVVDVSWDQAKTFLEQNHLQGAGTPAAIRHALIYEARIVAVCTWGTDRFSAGQSMELYRFCSEAGVALQGGLSKLVAHFIKEQTPRSLVTYADLRWGKGGVYDKAGFKRGGNTVPGYFWCKGRKRFNRHEFQKHKLADRLEKFDPAKTEVENCHDNGYWRIFDCGNAKWVMELGTNG